MLPSVYAFFRLFMHKKPTYLVCDPQKSKYDMSKSHKSLKFNWPLNVFKNKRGVFLKFKKLLHFYNTVVIQRGLKNCAAVMA